MLISNLDTALVKSGAPPGMLRGMPETARTAGVVLVAAFFIVLGAATASAQELPLEGLIGRGVSKILDGDTARARTMALADAHSKVVMEAVSASISCEEMAAYFLTLKNIFFDHAEIYLQRFKIIQENALFDTYQVTIQGFVQEELLQHDLEVMGILKPEEEKVRALVMIVEKDMDTSQDAYWWASDEQGATARFNTQGKLERHFAEKGVHIVDPQTCRDQLRAEDLLQGPEPEMQDVCRFAARLNVRLVVQGRSAFTRSTWEKRASLAGVQCDLSAQVIDVAKGGAVLVQAATYALGIHIDEEAAADDAAEKASERIAGQLMDKIYLQMRSTRDFVFVLNFEAAASDPEMTQWLAAFKTGFPEITVLQTTRQPGEPRLTVTAESTIPGAALLKRLFEYPLEGFSAEMLSLNENMIELRIVPVKRSE